MSTGFLNRGRGRDSLRRHWLPNALADERRSFKPEKQDRYLTGAPFSQGSVAKRQTQPAQDGWPRARRAGSTPAGTPSTRPTSSASLRASPLALSTRPTSSASLRASPLALST